MTLDANRRGKVDRIKPTIWNALGTLAFGVLWIAGSALLSTPFLFSGNFLGVLIGCFGFGFFVVYLGVIKIPMQVVQICKALRVFEEAHAVTEARVLDRDIEWDIQYDATTYYVIIQFDAGGQQMTLRAAVSRGLYDKVEQGQTLTIRYANADPRIALLEGEW